MMQEEEESGEKHNIITVEEEFKDNYTIHNFIKIKYINSSDLIIIHSTIIFHH